MAIHRRSTLPETEATDTEDNPSDGRSVDLQGIRYDVYMFIRGNPMCTRDDVSRGLGMKSSTATARIKELIDLGYVAEPRGARKRNQSGVNVRCLVVSDRTMSGKTNDRVAIEVSLTIDCNGKYGATARVVGGHHQSGAITTLRTRTLTILAPPNALKLAKASTSNVTRVTRLDLQLSEAEIIDSTCEIVNIE